MKTYKGKILVIDDTPGIKKGLARWLKQAGYNYTFVESDRKARVLLKHTDYDAVVYGREFLFSPWSLSRSHILPER